MFVMVRYFSDRLLATDPLLAGFHVWNVQSRRFLAHW